MNWNKYQKLESLKAIKNKSRNQLTKLLSERESKVNYLQLRIKEIKVELIELRNRFSKPKIKAIRRNIYENGKNLSGSKIKEIGKKSYWIRGKSFKLKKCYDYDDTRYKGIRDVRNLFGLPID